MGSTTAQNILECSSAILFYLSTIIGGFYLLGLMFLLLLFTPLWPVVVLYLGWTIIFEWKTAIYGGRSFGNEFMRSLGIWKYIRDYYPITFEKTADLDPDRNYIFAYHPHGYLCEGAAISFQTDALGFKEKYPGITPHMSVHTNFFRGLLSRDILLSLGFIDVARESLKYALTQLGPGHSVLIVVGGGAELFAARPDLYNLTLKNRKGFVKLALQTGADLVPVFAFGSNNVLHQLGNVPGCLWFRLQHWIADTCRKHFGRAFCFPVFYGRLGLLVPFRTPINVIVGRPIPVPRKTNPTEQEIDDLHETYKKELRKLFERHRDKYNVAKESKLVYE